MALRTTPLSLQRCARRLALRPRVAGFGAARRVGLAVYPLSLTVGLHGVQESICRDDVGRSPTTRELHEYRRRHGVSFGRTQFWLRGKH